jgi:hypothetical protein
MMISLPGYVKKPANEMLFIVVNSVVATTVVY